MRFDLDAFAIKNGSGFTTQRDYACAKMAIEAAESALLAQAEAEKQAAVAAALEQAAKTVEVGFEQCWVVHDTLDAIRALIPAEAQAAPQFPQPIQHMLEVEIRERVSEQTKKLREALEFYARINSASEARRIFVQDGGAKARAALAESEGQ